MIDGAPLRNPAFQETLVIDRGNHRLYIATARMLDDEMVRKVERHKDMRGAGWETIEAPLNPEAALSARSSGKAILLDCVTMWLMNHLMEETDLAQAEQNLRAALDTCQADCVVVTNELGLGIVPSDSLSRRFRQAQGELNQRLAVQADTVVNVIAGLPQVLKGTL